MEKENVILNDDELKNVSGGSPIPPYTEHGCARFPRKDVCEQFSDKCYWDAVKKQCLEK